MPEWRGICAGCGRSLARAAKHQQIVSDEAPALNGTVDYAVTWTYFDAVNGEHKCRDAGNPQYPPATNAPNHWPMEFPDMADRTAVEAWLDG